MNHQHVCIFVLLFVTFITGTSAVQNTCPAGSERLNCVPCRKGSDFNYVDSLPFSNDLTKLDVIDATSSQITVNTKINQSAIINQYAFVVVLALLPILFGVIFFTCFCCGRYLCCCCDKGGCCCGKRYPTPSRMLDKKGELRSKCMGFDHEKGSYGCRAKTCTYFLLILCFGVIGGMIYWGYYQSLNITGAFTPVVQIPAPLVTMLQDTFPQVSTFVDSAIGDHLVSGLRSLNSTICNAVDLRGTVRNLQCVKTIIVDNFINISVITGFISNLQAFINTIPTSQTITNELQPLNTSVNSIQILLPALQTGVHNFNTSLQPLQNLSPVSNSLLALDSAIQNLKPIPPKIKQFFMNLTSALPSKTFLVGSDGNGGLKNMISTQLGTIGCRGCGANWTVTQSWRDNLISQLTQMKANLTTLPSGSTFNNTLASLNTGLNATSAAVSNVNIQFTNLTMNIQNLPNTSTIYIPLSQLQNSLQGLDFTSVISVLVGLNSSLQHFPDTQPLINEINKIAGFSAVLPCTDGIATALTGLNATILVLPDMFNQIVSMVRDFRSTLNNTSQLTDSITNALNSTKNQLMNLPDFNGMVASLNSIESQKNQSMSQLNFTSTISSLISLQNQLQGGSINGSLLNNTQSIQNSINSPNTQPSANMTSQLSVIDTQRTTGPAQIQSAIDALNTWQKGFCMNNATILCWCDIPENCFNPPYYASSATCGAGNYCNMQYAAQYPGVCVNGGVPTNTTCHTVADCTSGSQCSTPQFTSILSTIQTLSNSQPDTSSLTSSMDSLSNQLNSIPNLQAQVNQINQLQNQVNGVPNLSSFSSQFTSLQNSINTAPSITSITSSFDGFTNAINNMPNFNSTIDTLNQMNSTVRGALGDLLPSILSYGNTAVNLLYGSQGLSKTLATLSRNNLQSACLYGGLSCRVTQVLSGVDNILTQITAINNITLLSSNSMVQEYLPKLQKAEDPATAQLGSINYFAVVSGQLTVSTPLDPTDTSMLVWQDSTGNAWPAGADNTASYCLTDQCLENTAKFVNKNSLPAVFSSVSKSKLASLPSLPSTPGPAISRENLTIVLYIFPLLICGLGLLSALCVCTGKWNPALCFSLCSCCCSMLIFLIVGLGLFPVVTVLSDVCASGEDIIYTLSPYVQQTVCNSFNGTVSTSNSQICTITPISNITIPLNTQSLIKNVLGHCADTTDPFFTIFDALGQGASPYLSSFVDSYLNSTDMIRPNLTAPIYSTVSGVSSSTGAFFDNMATVYSCSNFNTLIVGVKDAICCGFIGPVYWIVASWYVIAYALLCCGCPAGILGKKRFPSSIWGPYADDPTFMAIDVEGNVPNVIVPITPAHGRGVINPTSGLVNVQPAPYEDTHLLAHMKSDYEVPVQDEGVELAAL